MKSLILEADDNFGLSYTPEEQAFFQGWQPMMQATGKDFTESARVGRGIRAVPKRCWFNARRAVMQMADYADASYIEGWIVVPNMPFEHGWIVMDGRIIDPTLPNNPGVYFPGLEFQGRAGIETFLATAEGKKCKKTPFFYAFGWAGMKSPSFRRCYDEAMAYFQRLCDAAKR